MTPVVGQTFPLVLSGKPMNMFLYGCYCCHHKAIKKTIYSCMIDCLNHNVWLLQSSYNAKPNLMWSMVFIDRKYVL